jgi:hypothetical protein
MTQNENKSKAGKYRLLFTPTQLTNVSYMILKLTFIFGNDLCLLSAQSDHKANY